MARRRKTRKPITLRVTLGGYLFMLTSLIVGLAAFRSHMPMMFVLFGVMLGAMAFSAILAWRMVRHIDAQRELPAHAWQCETLYFGYFLRNARRLPALAVSLREIAPSNIENACGYCVHLPGRGMFRAGSRLTAYRRGRIELRGIRLSSRFPFGLFVVRRDIDQPANLAVWPAKGNLKADLLRHGAMQTSSAQPGRLQGGQDEFFGLRDYRSGDNPRWIHWRRSAGRRTPVVREMAHPVPEVLFLLLDVQCPDSPELIAQREKMLRFAATLIDHAQVRGFQVGLGLAGRDQVQIFPPSTSVDARTDMLDALADVADPACGPLNDVLEELPPPLLRSAQVLLLSPRPEAIEPYPLLRIGESSRHLEVIHAGDLDPLFDDNPVAAEER
jgi:uncharacterized protein (DUF58 family)